MLKVKDLIQLLEREDPEMEVRVQPDSGAFPYDMDVFSVNTESIGTVRGIERVVVLSA